jgi:hypothetical protein
MQTDLPACTTTYLLHFDLSLDQKRFEGDLSKPLYISITWRTSSYVLTYLIIKDNHYCFY